MKLPWIIIFLTILLIAGTVIVLIPQSSSPGTQKGPILDWVCRANVNNALNKCNSEKSIMQDRINNFKKCDGTGDYYTDTNSDKSNCGKCGNRCTSGTCINNKCNYDYNTDNTRCGRNAIICKENQQCISGNCYPQNVIPIAKDKAKEWFDGIAPAYKYQLLPNSSDPFESQIQLSGKLIPSIPLISGSNENILSLEIINYDDPNYTCSFINYNNGNDPFISFEKSKLIHLNGNFNYFCKINYIHFKYNESVYEIKVQETNNCSRTSTSNISIFFI